MRVGWLFQSVNSLNVSVCKCVGIKFSLLCLFLPFQIWLFVCYHLEGLPQPTFWFWWWGSEFRAVFSFRWENSKLCVASLRKTQAQYPHKVAFQSDMPPLLPLRMQLRSSRGNGCVWRGGIRRDRLNLKACEEWLAKIGTQCSARPTKDTQRSPLRL